MSMSHEAKIDLLALFATPVAVTRLAQAEATCASLRQTILAREQSHPSTDHSNLGGWQSTWDFEQWCGPAGIHLLDFARAMATRLTVKRDGQPAQVTWRANAWANINRHGHGNEFHTHPGAFWSGVFYIDDGTQAGNRSPSDLGGEFEVQDPRGVAPAMYRPDLVPAVPGGNAMGASETINPTAGTVIMFPSWLSHAVRPYRGSGTRISVAFNFSA
ncbi:MAG: TIGR02466 family protein [Alphaproteobacteria bacterium]